MKIHVDDAIEFEFAPWAIEQAGEILSELRRRHPERANDVSKAMLTLLLFSELESLKPGSIKGFLDAVNETASMSKSLKSP